MMGLGTRQSIYGGGLAGRYLLIGYSLVYEHRAVLNVEPLRFTKVGLASRLIRKYGNRYTDYRLKGVTRVQTSEVTDSPTFEERARAGRYRVGLKTLIAKIAERQIYLTDEQRTDLAALANGTYRGDE